MAECVVICRTCRTANGRNPKRWEWLCDACVYAFRQHRAAAGRLVRPTTGSASTCTPEQKGPSHLSIVERLGRGSIDFTIAEFADNAQGPRWVDRSRSREEVTAQRDAPTQQPGHAVKEGDPAPPDTDAEQPPLFAEDDGLGEFHPEFSHNGDEQ